MLGAGKETVQIIFRPASGTNLMNNKAWLYVTFDSLSLVADTVDCTLYYCNSTVAQQNVSSETAYSIAGNISVT
jgi:hypothetical protein